MKITVDLPDEMASEIMKVCFMSKKNFDFGNEETMRLIFDYGLCEYKARQKELLVAIAVTKTSQLIKKINGRGKQV
jgi:hypothetical protein